MVIADAAPLTVWVGSLRYVFPPGRDVIVGHGDQCDIRLDRPGLVGSGLPGQSVPDLVLRFAGTHWLAVDRSQHGIFLQGARMTTIDIRDRQTIAVGDPERGVRMTFEVSAPDDEPTPRTDPLGVRKPPVQPGPASNGPVSNGKPPTARIAAQPDAGRVPPEPATARIAAQPAEPPTARIAAQPAEPPTARITAQPAEPQTTRIMALPDAPAITPEPPTARIAAAPPPVPQPPAPQDHSPLERPTRPFRYPPTGTSGARPPTAEDTQDKGRGLVERVAEATRKLLPTRTDSGARADTPQTGRLPLLPGARTIGVAAFELGLTLDGKELLSNVTFTTRPGSLIAVVGPSSARNFALTGLLAGTRPPSGGVLTVDGHDVYAEPEAMRFRIGVVARDNRVHPSLSLERALEFAAELRLPPRTPVDDRARIIRQVLDELELTPHRTTRVAKLPPEARRCAAMAVELLARPSLLVVDEPGAGLDPAQQNHVMGLLRRQADLGCVVVVAGTSPGYLNMCDQVLLLTPAGTLAFAGPPSHIDSAMGTTDWLDILARISADPHGAHRAFLIRQQKLVSPTPPSVARPERLPPIATFGEQFRLAVRRQIRLLLSNPVHALFLLLLPVVLGLLTLLIPGDSGLDRAGPSSTNTHEAIEILAALNFAAVLLGTTATIRELVAERRIFRRDQQAGLSASAYFCAKLGVFGAIVTAQAAILTTIVISGKGGPKQGGALLGNANVEIYLSVGVTALVSAIVGLALSSVGKSMREVVPLVIPAVLASLLFAGSLVSLVGTWGYDQLSWFVPAQWGFAAMASTVNLRRADRLAEQNLLWTHYPGWWLFDMIILVVFGLLWAGVVRYRLRTPGPGITPLQRDKQKSRELDR